MPVMLFRLTKGNICDRMIKNSERISAKVDNSDDDTGNPDGIVNNKINK